MVIQCHCPAFVSNICASEVLPIYSCVISTVDLHDPVKFTSTLATSTLFLWETLFVHVLKETLDFKAATF